MEKKHLTHVRFKPTKRIIPNFNPKTDLDDIEIPKKSKEIAENYRKSNDLLDDLNMEMYIMFEDSIIYGFDYLHKKDKIIIPEINPVTIFYSNALMSHRKLIDFRENLYNNSPTLKNQKKPIDTSLFANFFQLASNCLINLQSTLESFANRLIPENYPFIDKNGDSFEPSIFHKLDTALPKIKNIRFKSKYKRDNKRIRDLIELRNDLIHLEPIKEDMMVKYKDFYRRMLKFDYTQAISSVEKYVNFYEPNLIESCSCGKEFYYNIYEKSID